MCRNVAQPARDVAIRAALASPTFRRALAGRLTGDTFSYGLGGNERQDEEEDLDGAHDEDEDDDDDDEEEEGEGSTRRDDGTTRRWNWRSTRSTTNTRSRRIRRSTRRMGGKNRWRTTINTMMGQRRRSGVMYPPAPMLTPTPMTPPPPPNTRMCSPPISLRSCRRL